SRLIRSSTCGLLYPFQFAPDQLFASVARSAELIGGSRVGDEVMELSWAKGRLERVLRSRLAAGNTSIPRSMPSGFQPSAITARMRSTPIVCRPESRDSNRSPVV